MKWALIVLSLGAVAAQDPSSFKPFLSSSFSENQVERQRFPIISYLAQPLIQSVSSFIFNTPPLMTSYLYTATVNYTSTSSVTSTCIPLSSFINAPPPSGPGYFTVPCYIGSGKKKRQVDEISNDGNNISAAGQAEHILSSKDETDDSVERSKRQFGYLQATIIPTALTSLFFTVTTTTTTMTAYTSMRCLPPNIAVC